MDAVSNNLANSDTTGYKSEEVEFANLLGEFIAGNNLGGGINATGVSTDYSQGAITQSNSPTDLALTGKGFFILQNGSGSAVDFTRDGHMTIGNNGNLVGFNGQNVMGYSVNAAGTPTGILAPVVVPQGSLPPSASTTLSVTGNLNAGSAVLTGAIDPTNAATYSGSMSAQVFDSLGNAHTLTLYFQNAGPTTSTPPNEQWNWSATLDGSATGLTGNTGSFQFNGVGAIVSGGVPTSPLTATIAGAKGLSLSLNFAQLTQFGAPNALSGTTNGYAAGSPQGVHVSNTGLVSVAYSNGQIVNVAQIAVATFTSEQNLQLGTNGVYLQTVASGAPTIGAAGSGSAGAIQASALESSNVNTTNQLVNLVVLQRNFQSDSKALQTENTILGTLVQI
jgi:flagellar hook protein FlgE